MGRVNTDLSRASINRLQVLTGKDYRSIKRSLAGLDPVSRSAGILMYSPAEALPRIFQSKEETELDRLHRMRADAQEMVNKQMRGELAPIDEIFEVMADLADQMRVVLGTLPDRLASACPKLGDKGLAVVRQDVAMLCTALDQITEGGHPKD